jgi:ubiquinone/menaquinone biosynthesis C-methylase UbiE
MKSEWFKDWFNTEEYLNVYQHRNESDAEEHIKLILKIVSLSSGAKVLDMACGAGRHAIILSRNKFKVTGIDLSEKLLTIAKNTAQSENLDIEFINADIRKFITDEKFDLVLNLFTSFGYFENDDENFDVLKKAYDLLKVGGYFVLDFFNSEFLTKNLIEFTSEKIDDGYIIQHRKILDKRVVKKIIISNPNDNREYEESVRMFTYQELKMMLTKIGFDIYKTFGDFLGNDFDHVNSPRLIFICRK